MAFPIAANISHEDQLKNLVEKTMETLGGIDSLVCNAATNTYMGSMLDMSNDQFTKVMNNNIRSNQILCNLCIPYMVENKDGTVIIISSILIRRWQFNGDDGDVFGNGSDDDVTVGAAAMTATAMWVATMVGYSGNGSDRSKYDYDER